MEGLYNRVFILRLHQTSGIASDIQIVESACIEACAILLNAKPAIVQMLLRQCY